LLEYLFINKEALMKSEQAIAHNLKITEQIKKLEEQKLSRYLVKVVERTTGGKRAPVEEEQTDYIKEGETKELYEKWRSLYPEQPKYIIFITPIEDVKRVITVVEPTRTDADREPNMSDPDGVGDPFAEI
jgi:hypothetical protein